MARVLSGIAAAALIICTATAAAAQSASFQGLGFLPGDVKSTVAGISADGSVVIGFSAPNIACAVPSGSDCGQAIRWTASSGMTGLGSLQGHGSVAKAVSADGSVVIGDSNNQVWRWTTSNGLVALFDGSSWALSRDGSVVAGNFNNGAFRWTAPTGAVNLGFLPQGSESLATNLNADGSVVVGIGWQNPSYAGNTQAFRWTSASGMIGLGILPGGLRSFATAVNAEGSVVVGGSNDPTHENQAFRWTSATGMTGLGFPGDPNQAGMYSAATLVSADGSVVAGNPPFRWTAATGLVALQKIYPVLAMTPDGSVIVGAYNDGTAGATRWTAANGGESIAALLTANHINLTGWTLREAVAISADGTIVVGNGTDPSGRPQGWIARLPLPAPPELQVSPPSSFINPVGPAGGPFTPNTFSYQLSASAGSVSFSISGIPTWLTASFTSGTVTAGSPLTVTFTVNASANSLPVGTDTATITFTNTTNGQGTQSRTATLKVQPNMLVTPNTSAEFIGPPGGPFTPPQVTYAIRTESGGPENWVTDAVPPWLLLSPNSGSVSSDPQNMVVTVNSSGLGPGTYSTPIIFRRQVAGPVFATRMATMIITSSQTTSIVAAVAPNARTGVVGGPPITGFATIINAGISNAVACSIALPEGVPASLHYVRTIPSTNTPIGAQDIPVDLPGGGSQTFVFSIAPIATFSLEIALVFKCSNTPPAAVVPGLNTFLISVNDTAIADMISIADTSTHDGNMVINGSNGIGLIVTAAVNIGAAGTVTFAPTDTPIAQAPRNLPVDLSICQTNTQGLCINPNSPGASSTVTVPRDVVVFFSIFAAGKGVPIPYDPANNRVFVIGTQGSTPVGEASAAIKMQ